MRGPLSTCRHTTPSKNSSTQKAIQSPPQLQFPDLQPFLRKAGYKCAAPDSLPLPVLLHPHQPFPLPSAFKPLGKSSFSTTNTTPKLLGTHRANAAGQSCPILEISAPISTQPELLSHLCRKAKQQPYFKKKLLQEASLLQQE